MQRIEKEGMLYNLFYEAIIALMPKHYKQEKFQGSTSKELKSKSPEQKVGRLHPIYLKKIILQEQAELSTGIQG